MADDPEKFFMVYAPEFGPPTFRHPLRDDAVAEARRLATKNPGHWFFILEPSNAIRTNNFEVVNFKPSDDGIPF